MSELVAKRRGMFPSSGEINFSVKDVREILAKIEGVYGAIANDVDRTDGLSFLFDDWRFNIRASNTEPLVRLNVESRGDKGLVQKMTKQISEIIA